MALNLTFRYRDDEPWIVVRHAFDIITTYLQADSTISAAETAERLDNLTPSKRTLSNGEQAEESGSFLLEFWEVFVATVRQIPHGHTAQQRLVDLLERLEGLPTPSSEGFGPMWAGLPYLQNVLDEGTQEPTNKEDTYTPFREWVDLHSFTACTYGKNIFDGSRIAIRTLRDATEKTRSADADVNECRDEAAAQYTIYSAAQLLQVMQCGGANEGEQRALKSERFQDEAVFSKGRWDFWRDHFTTLSQSSPEAARALHSMRTAERH